MAYKYTWEEVEKAINDNGLFFSDADRKLAQTNPDAGMSIVNYKLDYKNATTDDQKALANSGAESIRSQYGNYTAGVQGDQFYLNDPSPQSFTYQQPGTGNSDQTQSSATQTSEFKNPYADQQQAALDAILNRGEYTNPYAGDLQNAYDAVKNRQEYANPYASDLQAAYEAIKNRQDFSYDPTTDAAWQSAKKMYAREADRATQDTMGQAAALTGGMASTAAVTAASQAGDYYRAQMNDALGEYQQQAYQRYLDDANLDYNLLDAVNNLSAEDYQKYLDEVNLDYNLLDTVTGMSDSDYQKWIDNIGLKYDDLSAITSLSQQARDEYDTDRNFAYNQWTDELGFQTDKEATKYEKEQYDREYADAKNSDMYQMYMALYEQTGDVAFLNKAKEYLVAMG